MAVTELMDSSVGANTVLAIRSHSRQNTEPPRKLAGITRTGLEVRSRFLVRWGTAIPTKETGPAKAVTAALRTLESSTSAV